MLTASRMGLLPGGDIQEETSPQLVKSQLPDDPLVRLNTTSSAKYYYTGLNGVNQSLDKTLSQALWASLGVLCVGVLAARLLQAIRRKARLASNISKHAEDFACHQPPHQKWTSWVKKHLIYAPLWRTRHHREIRLSAALNFGTLPSRLQMLLLVFYIGSNIAYLLMLDWNNARSFALCAELRGRSGTLAAANMVPLVLMAARNNPLISLLGISFDSYNFMHRWMGRISVMNVLVHTIAWLIPAVADIGWKATGANVISNLFLGAGSLGTVTMLLLLILSLSPIRHAFYETFLATHIILALIVFSCAWLHYAEANLPGALPQLPWTIAAVCLWCAERMARLFRLLYLSWSTTSLVEATCEPLLGGATRVTIRIPRYVEVKPGTHTYLRLCGIRPWECHPFSIAWVDHRTRYSRADSLHNPVHGSLRRNMMTDISFLIGARTGWTRKLHEMSVNSGGKLYVKAAVEGPYGGLHTLSSYGHVFLFAGSTGITHQLSHLRHLLEGRRAGTVATRRLTLIWVIREPECLGWARSYFDRLLQIPCPREHFRLRIFFTRAEQVPDSGTPTPGIELFSGRPNVLQEVKAEVQKQAGTMCVTVCGPGSLADDVRSAVRATQGESAIDFLEESFTW